MILGTMQANLDEVEVLLAARDLDAAEFEQMVGRHRPQIVFLIDYFLLEQRNLFDRLGIEFVDDNQPQGWDLTRAEDHATVHVGGKWRYGERWRGNDHSSAVALCTVRIGSGPREAASASTALRSQIARHSK